MILDLVTYPNPLLYATSQSLLAKEIQNFSQFLSDMAETMYFHGGVGVSAVQVGVPVAIVAIDIGAGLEVYVNPVIVELIGPKVQGNHENFTEHVLISHVATGLHPDAPRTFEGLRDWLQGMDIEGIVFHHPDGRMAKIKKRDFGLKRK